MSIFIPSKRYLIAGIVLAVAFCAGLLLSKPSQKSSNGPYNVILISVDSVRADRVGLIGGGSLTPNIDRFFQKGITFTNYIASSYLTPISEMSVHTGLYPTQSGVTGFGSVLPNSIPTLAQRLQEAGYETVADGTSPEFFRVLPAMQESFSRGFDSYFKTASRLNSDLDAYKLRGAPPPDAQSFLSRKGPQSKPFFLWVALGTAHFPYGDFCTDTQNYSGALKGLRLHWNNDTLRRYYDGKIWSLQSAGVVEGKLTAPDVSHIQNCYDGGVAKTDEYVGKILDELAKRDLLDKSIVIVESEHGEDLGEHGTFLHYDIYGATTHVPLLLRYPGVHSQRVTTPVESVDVVPTIFQILGFPQPAGIAGTSALPTSTRPEKLYAVSARTPTWENGIGDSPTLRNLPGDYPFEDNVFPTFLKTLPEFRRLSEGDKKPDLSIRSSDWELIWRRERVAQRYSWWSVLTGKTPSIPEYELYDLRADPGELHNVYGAEPSIEKELKRALMAWTHAHEGGEKAPTLPVQPYF